MNCYRFWPASPEDLIVYGAQGPSNDVEEWISFMQRQGIERVCCLQLERPDLGTIYETGFGKDNVKDAPIEDLHLSSLSTLRRIILPFLQDSYVQNRRVVVHCAGGKGRTGHVLAAWLVFHNDLLPAEAISVVEQTGRDPREAVRVKNATEAELLNLLRECKDA